MAFSYAYTNLGGSGDRTTVTLPGSLARLTVTSSLTISGGGAFSNLCDGAIGDTTADSIQITSVAASGKEIKFNFTNIGAKVITEFVFKQSTSDTHGVWDFKGSMDDSSYTTLQANITLGGSTVQTQAVANTTKYLFYKFVGVSGNTNATPWLREFEFKISGNPTVEYGDRTGTATVTATLGTGGGGTLSNLIDGGFNNSAADSFGYTAETVTGKVLKFDFGSGNDFRCTGFTVWQQTTTTHGTFSFEGSPDNSAWTTLATGIVLGTALQKRYEITNAAQYRYYRLIGTSGSNSNTPWIQEYEFEEEALAVSNVDGGLSSAGTGAATFVGSTLADGTFTMAGAGGLSAGGAANRDGVFTMAGVGALSAVGSKLADGVVTMAGSATMGASPVVTPAARKAMVIIICG